MTSDSDTSTLAMVTNTLEELWKMAPQGGNLIPIGAGSPETLAHTLSFVLALLPGIDSLLRVLAAKIDDLERARG